MTAFDIIVPPAALAGGEVGIILFHPADPGREHARRC